MLNVCIYHAGCTDGFGAAYAVRSAYPNIVMCEGFYNQTPPDVTDANVYIVDFSYPKAVILQMLEVAASITIIDHHASAIADLKDLRHPKLRTSFSLDNSKSGAVLAWEYMHPCTKVPALLLHIQDRDLWHFKLDNTREIIAALYSHAFDFDLWEAFMEVPHLLIDEGSAIIRTQESMVSRGLDFNVRYIKLGHQLTPLVNCDKSVASDMGHALGLLHPFATTYYDSATHREYSLRSRKGTGADVSKIAKRYGGGGHRNAAGFRVPHNLSIFKRIHLWFKGLRY